jgi:hypothetical protein
MIVTNMTFQEAYIKKKVNAHPEPERKGTPKGEPIGLSKVKFEAALWCALSCHKLEDIAVKVGKSHSLIKKWRTEEPFKQAGQDLIKDFAHKLFKQALKVAREHIPVTQDNGVIQFEGDNLLPNKMIGHFFADDFADKATYAKEAKNIISALIGEEFKKINPSRLTADEYRWQLDRVIACYRILGIDEPSEITKAISDTFHKNVRQPLLANMLSNRPSKPDEVYSIVGSGNIIDDMTYG